MAMHQLRLMNFELNSILRQFLYLSSILFGISLRHVTRSLPFVATFRMVYICLLAVVIRYCMGTDHKAGGEQSRKNACLHIMSSYLHLECFYYIDKVK